MGTKKENNTKNYNFLKKVALFMFFFFTLFSFSNKIYAQNFTIDSSCNLVLSAHDPAQMELASSTTQHIYYYATQSTPQLGYVGFSSPPIIGYNAFGDLTSFPADPTGVLGGSGQTYITASDIYGKAYYLRASYVKTGSTCSNIQYTGSDSETSSVGWFTSPNWNEASSNATTTTNVTFTFPFAINSDELDNYGEACIFYSKNLISSSSPINNWQDFTSICQPINFAGEQYFSTTTVLTNNTLYTYYGMILGTSTQSNPYSLSTLTNELQIGVVAGSGIVPAGWVQQIDENSTSTDPFVFGGFLNVPNLLKTKIPFGYVFQIGGILLNIGSSTEIEIPTGTFNIDFASGTPAYKNLEVDLFSTTTITHFLPPDILSLLRGIMIAIEFTGLGFYLWKRGTSII